MGKTLLIKNLIEEWNVLNSILDDRSIKKQILIFCKKKKMMTEIQKHFKMSRGSVRHHLNFLEKFNLIYPMKRDLTEKGRPTYISTNNTKINDLEEKRKKLRGKIIKIILNNPNINLILNQLNNKNLSLNEIKTNIKMAEDEWGYVNLIFSLETLGYIEEFYRITSKGRDFLKTNG